MTLYQKIKTVAEYGHYSLVETNGGEMFIVSPVKDSGGDYRESCFGDSIEECMETIGDVYGSSWGDWGAREIAGYKFIKAFALPHKYYKAGDKVDVMKNTRDLPGFNDWSDTYKEMVGQKGLEIKHVLSTSRYEVYTKDRSNWFLVPHECLAPHIPEEDNKQVVQLKDGKKYLVQVIEEVDGQYECCANETLDRAIEIMKD